MSAEAPDRAFGNGRLDWLLVAAGLAVSVALLWVVTGETLVVSGFAAGLLALAALGRILLLRKPAIIEQEIALPDWSVTVAAIERPDTAVAITDRANRLVCANHRYEEWFGAHNAPPRLPVDEASFERLAKAARTAWRDGRGRADLLESPGVNDPANDPASRGAEAAGGRWQGEAERSGRGEDYLIWRFTPILPRDPVAELVEQLAGKPGRALARAGLAAAVVEPDGTIAAASAGFALRAAGDGLADMAGKDFVSFLRQEEGERITWAREGRRGQPLTLFFVPITDPDVAGEPDPDTTPSLMLIAEAGSGIGHAGGESTPAAPHLEALLGSLPLGLAMADRDGRLLFANKAFARAAGREAEGMPIYPGDLVIREDKGPLSDAIRRFAQGPANAGDIAVRLVSQPEEPVSLSLAGVRGLGEASVLLGLNDSSEETRLKRQVAQATKMQAVGQLAGGVAHDFNNVLTAILGTCDLMLLRHTPGDSDYDDIQQIRANSNRAASLTRQLLAFSRQQTLRPEVLQLPDVVTDISQMLKRLIGEKIQLVVRHDRNLGPVRADPTQLEQVIVNLAVNGRDAMHGMRVDGSGKLSLLTRKVPASEVRAMHSDILPVGDYTALVVEDTGAGIPPENLAKIFEPFFTTKEHGRGGQMGGTGLGLSTVYGIVKQSGGFIFAESEVGKGTRFTVYLPVHQASAGDVAAIAAKPEEPRQWAGGGRILLVEDEDSVRIVAERALTRAGYEVTTASDGEAGLDLVKLGRRYDLVVSDVVMPIMDGPTMGREIRELAPQMPLLFMSGYAEEQLRKEIDIADVHFLPKPFSVQQITEKVGTVLAKAKAKAAGAGNGNENGAGNGA